MRLSTESHVEEDETVAGDFPAPAAVDLTDGAWRGNDAATSSGPATVSTLGRWSTLLGHLMHVGATDLHVAVGATPRLRIDGRLLEVAASEVVDAEWFDAALAEMLDERQLARFRADRQIDFAFSWGDSARFRANAFFQMDRPAIALRLIPSVVPTPEQLGLPVDPASLLTRPHGLVLVTGPTGSGKSTTLAAMIGWINANRGCHVLTVEDPIEFLHPSAQSLVNQRQIGTDAPSFGDALRAALREDPDVVLVGEMRDLETIALTLTLAETGHLVFATLHTNDAAQTVDRIIDVFPADQQNQVRTQFSMTLAAVISQRLVPRLGGGRVAAYEVLMGTPAVSNIIREGKIRQLRNIIATGNRDGMFVLEQSLGHLVANGVISHDEAMAASIHPEDIVGLSPGLNERMSSVAAAGRAGG